MPGMPHMGKSEYYPKSENLAYPPVQTGYPGEAPPGSTVSYPQQKGQQQPVKAVIVQQPKPATPTDYLFFAIIVTIFCGLPFGIVGIIKASQAKNRFASRDYDGAEDSSRSAKNWSIAGLVTGCLLITLAVIIIVILETTDLTVTTSANDIVDTDDDDIMSFNNEYNTGMYWDYIAGRNW